MVASTLLFSVAAAQDHLEPEESFYQSRAGQDEIILHYHRNVVRKFSEIYSGQYPLRAIIQHSFEPEYAIALTAKDDDPKLIGLRTETQLWAYSWLEDRKFAKRANSQEMDKNTQAVEDELRASIPSSVEDVPLQRCEIPISSKDQSLYESLWRKALYATKYPKNPRFGLDGVTYHFSGDFGFGSSPAGQIWSPRKGSQMQRLTEIAETLYRACAENNPQQLFDARRQAEALCSEIRCGQ
jgi:hypothetical protein